MRELSLPEDETDKNNDTFVVLRLACDVATRVGNRASARAMAKQSLVAA